MSDDTQSEAPESAETKTQQPVDLSSLKSLSFGPSWTTGNVPSPKFPPTRERGDERRHGRFGGSRDMRGQGGRPPRSFEGAPRREGDRFPRRSFEGAPRREGDRRAPQGRPPFRRGGDFAANVFKPVVDVLFYPEDAAFRALTKAIRSGCRTYELFEVAQLILEKNERFVAVLKPFAGTPDAQKIYQSVPDGLVFETEEAAVNHVCQKHINDFFRVEEIEVEPPKGAFSGVYKCELSGALIAPPNYHRCQELVRAHHAERYPDMPFGRFQSSLSLDKSPEALAAWLEQMKKTTRYVEKNAAEGAEPAHFETLAAARAHLLATCKDKVVRESAEARLPGRMLAELPHGALRRSIEFSLEHQRRFPLTTANNLRGRLRRMKFGLYKRGAKGVSYVCAVKRRFRDEHTVFAENLQALITFIEKNPNVLAKDLPEKFLGIAAKAPTHDKVVLAAATAAVEEAAAKTPAAPETVAAAQADAAAPESAPASVAAETASAPAPEANAPQAPQPEPPAAEPAPAPSVPESAPAPEDPNAERLRGLVKDLHWLVTEGYVTEFGDGRLFAPPPMPAAKIKQVEAAEADGHPAAEPAPTSKFDSAVADILAQAVGEKPAEPAAPQAPEDAPEKNV